MFIKFLGYRTTVGRKNLLTLPWVLCCVCVSCVDLWVIIKNLVRRIIFWSFRDVVLGVEVRFISAILAHKFDWIPLPRGAQCFCSFVLLGQFAPLQCCSGIFKSNIERFWLSLMPTIDFLVLKNERHVKLSRARFVWILIYFLILFCLFLDNIEIILSCNWNLEWLLACTKIVVIGGEYVMFALSWY